MSSFKNQKYPQCTVHSKELIYICREKECRDVLTCCIDCITQDHKGHSKIKIEQFMDQLGMRIEQLNENPNLFEDSGKYSNQIYQFIRDLESQFNAISSQFRLKLNNLKQQIWGFSNMGKFDYELLKLENYQKKQTQFMNSINPKNRLQFKSNINEIYDVYENILRFQESYEQKIPITANIEKTQNQMKRILNELQQNLDQLVDLKEKQINSIIKTETDKNTYKAYKGSHIYYTQEKEIIDSHENIVFSIAFSNDQKYFASGSSDRTIKIFDCDNLKELNQIKTDQIIFAVLFSRDDKQIISGNRLGKIMFWDLENLTCVHTMNAHTDIVTSLCLSQDGKRLLSGSGDDFLKVWNIEKFQTIKCISDHGSTINYVNFSPSDQYFISAGNDKCIRIFDSQTYKSVKVINEVHNTGFITDVTCFSSDEKQLAIAGPNRNVTILNLEKNTERSIKNGHECYPRSVLISQNMKQIISGDQKGFIKIWHFETLQLQQTLVGHTDQIRSFALSEKEDKLISASVDTSIRVWSLEKI